MRGYLYVAIILLPVLSAAQITVDGYAYLTNQSDHSEIMVVFERTVPTSLFDTTYTNTYGYYSKEIETGIYNVIFSKEEYLDEELDDQQLYSDTILQTVTLIGSVNISGYVLPIASKKLCWVSSYGGCHPRIL